MVRQIDVKMAAAAFWGLIQFANKLIINLQRCDYIWIDVNRIAKTLMYLVIYFRTCIKDVFNVNPPFEKFPHEMKLT